MVVGVAPAANAGLRLAATHFDFGATSLWPLVLPNLQAPAEKNKTIRLENVGRN
jgi:hypothetical protein